jgi:hypothetical protein
MYKLTASDTNAPQQEFCNTRLRYSIRLFSFFTKIELRKTLSASLLYVYVSLTSEYIVV